MKVRYLQHPKILLMVPEDYIEGNILDLATDHVGKVRKSTPMDITCHTDTTSLLMQDGWKPLSIMGEIWTKDAKRGKLDELIGERYCHLCMKQEDDVEVLIDTKMTKYSDKYVCNECVKELVKKLAEKTGAKAVWEE